MMASQALRLLGICAAWDFRNVDDFDANVWAETLGDLDFNQCARAIRDHYRSTTERIMPADIITRVRIMNRPSEDEQRRKDLHLELPEFDPELNARGTAAVRAALAERHTDHVSSGQEAT